MLQLFMMFKYFNAPMPQHKFSHIGAKTQTSLFLTIVLIVCSGGTLDRVRRKASCSTVEASKELAINAQQGGTQTSADPGDSQLYLKVLPVTRADIE